MMEKPLRRAKETGLPLYCGEYGVFNAAPDPDRVRATPRARTLAKERSVDLSEIAGSGPSGAVRVADVERYLEALEETEEPLEGDVPTTPVAAGS